MALAGSLLENIKRVNKNKVGDWLRFNVIFNAGFAETIFIGGGELKIEN